MRTAEAGGIGVLALVIGGSLAVRAGWMPHAGAAITDAGAPAAGQPTELTAAGSSTVDVNGLHVRLRASTWPVAALRDTTFDVQVQADGGPSAFSDGVLSFAMQMPMGEHRYRLIQTSPDRWTATVVLPACPSGASRWTATLEGRVGDQPLRASFTFDLARPPTAGR
jgi:hypothetical protein